uniref:Uncharacterized protein n=1 Tax=Chromera velia CCMP2878 TaxID=1169474 RepID=A0A0G4HGX1_9ALVE|eukprot:Cvel_6794.t1-p1 / transcript=Cvel_6794.t1 / gene=Cvel_6794 / organism=Chromera_velia_CCMP2878 / gene_product=hypothetical protein / transcript_product=hypothetical protein / location=Cvel_scaffold341:82133-88792(+) / protein_length=302 / sequence_SO=supercontig / SO=protein_coding / is_pseudo=false
MQTASLLHFGGPRRSPEPFCTCFVSLVPLSTAVSSSDRLCDWYCFFSPDTVSSAGATLFPLLSSLCMAPYRSTIQGTRQRSAPSAALVCGAESEVWRNSAARISRETQVTIQEAGQHSSSSCSSSASRSTDSVEEKHQALEYFFWKYAKVELRGWSTTTRGRFFLNQGGLWYDETFSTDWFLYYWRVSAPKRRYILKFSTPRLTKKEILQPPDSLPTNMAIDEVTAEWHHKEVVVLNLEKAIAQWHGKRCSSDQGPSFRRQPQCKHKWRRSWPGQTQKGFSKEVEMASPMTVWPGLSNTSEL